MKKLAAPMTRTGLTMRWVPVTTADGRRTMEMRWSAPPTIKRQAS
jgi:hypothetical protein